MAQNARKRIRSRPGKPTGSAKDAARLTTPRIPAQDTTMRWLAGSTAPSRWKRRGRTCDSPDDANTHMKRLTMSVADMAKPCETRSRVL